LVGMRVIGKRGFWKWIAYFENILLWCKRGAPDDK